ncbi:MAG: nucleotidyltransferase domain-containing protein [Calditrichota bacterium]
MLQTSKPAAFLNDPRLGEMVKLIAAAAQPTQIYLFGSRAKGQARPDSDYDLVVIYDGEKPKSEYQLELYSLFRGRNYGLDIMVLTSSELEHYRHVANTLAREISEYGELLYE